MWAALAAIEVEDPLWLTFLLGFLFAGAGVAIIRFRFSMLKLSRPGRMAAWMNHRFPWFEEFNVRAWGFTCWVLGLIFLAAGAAAMVGAVVSAT